MLLWGALIVGAAVGVTAAQDRAPNRREIALLARDHQFIPNKIEVTQDDLVRVTFTSEARPASFAVDAYRISKRAGANQTIVFEFRADQAGTFTFYCGLTADPRCKDMKGTLVVSPK
jgi:heme/copper-type cytochrome/quinol oxidase subunit 2